VTCTKIEDGIALTNSNVSCTFGDYGGEFTSGDIKQATELKLRKKVMSFADVIGYVMARKYGVKFLTGDEDFRGMKNVEFVK